MAWSALNDAEKATLRFEELHWKWAGAKDAEIRERFFITPTVYYQRLGQLIGKPEALAYSPMVVRRLLRLRDARREQRSAERMADTRG